MDKKQYICFNSQLIYNDKCPICKIIHKDTDKLQLHTYCQNLQSKILCKSNKKEFQYIEIDEKIKKQILSLGRLEKCNQLNIQINNTINNNYYNNEKKQKLYEKIIDTNTKVNIYNETYKHHKEMNTKIIEAINLNYMKFTEILVYKNYEDIKLYNSKQIYKYNKETHIWQNLKDKSKILLLIKDVINDFNKLKGIIENKIIQEKIRHYDSLNNW